MKIQYLFPSFPVGVQTFAVSDVAALQKMGHEVRISVMRRRPSSRAALDQLGALKTGTGISYASLRDYVGGILQFLLRPHTGWFLVSTALAKGWSSPVLLATTLLSLPRVMSIIRDVVEHNPDIVHAFWGKHPSMVLAGLRRDGRWKGTLSLFVGAYDLEECSFLVDIGLASAETVFTHSEANRGFFAKRMNPAQDLTIVYRGIPLELATEPAPERVPNLLITASMLSIHKNVEAVILAFARLHGERPEARLLVCGDGADAPRLKRLASGLPCAEAIEFTGHLSRSALFLLMQKAEIFLFMSKKASEQLPNVLKEAMLAGALVVTSRSVGLEELICDEREGRIVDPDDPAAVDQALNEILSMDEAEKTQRRAHCSDRIRQSFSAEACMAAYVEMWEKKMLQQGQGFRGAPVGDRQALADRSPTM